MATEEKNKKEQTTTESSQNEGTKVESDNKNKADVKEINKEETEKKQDKKIEEKQDECETLKKNLSEEKDKYMRLLAEYDNFRKRTAKEKSEIFSDATIKTINDILPIYDNFERALSTECGDENFKKGVEMIFNQFTEFFNKIGVETIDPLGEEFDPDIAQAVNQVEDENYGENVVSQVFQKGYKLGEKIIRYAMVVVANP